MSVPVSTHACERVHVIVGAKKQQACTGAHLRACVRVCVSVYVHACPEGGGCAGVGRCTQEHQRVQRSRCACSCTDMFACGDACVGACVDAWVCVYVYAHVHTRVYARLCVHKCLYVCMHM